ncbi:hypothetical protein [Candidatus Methylobacter oryzae]|uniref:hypothetical protein n=1 Tax=Candidatus Methylobacter oryzae TaxID=2497749 RepID=UPI0018AD418C|nr:hypothetical protein [Candidatus Methylobacter oryzae]
MPHLVQPKLLEDEIKDAESQVLTRQQVIDLRTTLLVRKIYQEMTEPASLLLAGGIGFVISEITKRRPVKVRDTAGKAAAAVASPLNVAMSLLTSARTLYTALPIAWLVKSGYRPGTPARKAGQPAPPPRTIPNRRRYHRRKPLS